VNRATLLILFFAFAAHAQPAFEVASVKIFKIGSQPENRKITASHGSLRMEQQTLRDCIAWAYGLSSTKQISGPGWLDTEEYDISAQAPDATTLEQLRLMLQALLAQRFKLVVHRKTEQRSIYSLVPGKGGLKMKEVQTEPVKGMHMDQDGAVMTYKMVTNMTRLTEILPIFLDRPVIDSTGLTGVYEIALKVEIDPQARMPEPGQMFNGFGLTPSIFAAVEALGLKLVAAKGPEDILVVDHAERPSAN